MEYLKKAEPIGEQVTQDIRESVSEILMAVEREGTTAVRRYSEQLDDWNPESFVVSKEEILRAVTAVADGEAIFGRPFTKLNVATRTEAAILARDLGLGHN